MSETESTTSPLTDRALYITNTWYSGASREEIKRDIHYILSLERECDDNVFALSLQSHTHLLGPKAAKRKAINREASATEKRPYAEQCAEPKIKKSIIRCISLTLD